MKVSNFITGEFMKISRWIYVPLFTSIFYAVWMLLFGFAQGFGSFLYYLAGGALIGFILQFISSKKAGKLSKDKD